MVNNANAFDDVPFVVNSSKPKRLSGGDYWLHRGATFNALEYE
jgi:hypothetical protein